ncbi:MFS transporter [Catenovulum sp. 2E275]|uniref:MFS transporter n=1 Tax=Catenovulum sp. 2E275 TaxID=2980497 RepID=UPI0021CF4750|nr:MFS transporter [Catenovulum sp. 2E275]MCU4674698.1 MFS transporter [Catenovulum sp. 2E275]
MNNINQSRIFLACCVALIVTAMTFAIRAGILGQLGTDFGLTDTQLGWINGMAFLGFPVAMMVGGLLYNFLGAKKLMFLAFFCHLLGLVLTMMADGFVLLLLSSFFVGFANGSVEAGANPLIAEMYKNNKTTMLNKFHVWFPGGIVIGAITSNFMTGLDLGWQSQIAVMILPTLIYGWLMFGQTFPKDDEVETSTPENIKALFTPLFLFMIFCMTLTAITEFGPQQWIDRILGSTEANPMLILAMTTGVMALGRFFAGPLVHALNPVGVLLTSAIISTLGIYLLSIAAGGLIYVAAIVFALGVTYFWPTMIGFISEYTPKTGALGMSLMGGAGMFSVSMWNPVIGNWIDEGRVAAEQAGAIGAQAEIVAGQVTLSNIMYFPMVLIVCFAGLYFLTKGKHHNVHNSAQADNA